MGQNFCYSRYGVLLCFFGTVVSNGLIIQAHIIYECVTVVTILTAKHGEPLTLRLLMSYIYIWSS